MSGSLRGGTSRIWMTAAALALAGTAAALLAYVVTDRRHVEEGAAKDILFDATLAATSLDAILRMASIELAYPVAPDGLARDHVHRAASNLPEANNVYVLDETGAVVATAYQRRDPAFPVDPAVFGRMKAGAVSDVRICDVPSEGGTVLSYVRRVDAGDGSYRYAVALYTGYTLRGGVSMLLSTAYGFLDVIDSYGASLSLIGTPADPEPSPAASGAGNLLAATVSLASIPLAIRVSADAAALFAEWRSRTAVLCAVVAVFALTVGALLAVALALWRKNLGADRLRMDIEARDTLFREVNHRAKNNLTIVQTVLEMGASGIDEHPERASSLMNSAIDRLRAMALLHELLSAHATDAREDVGSYMRNLVDAISEAYDRGGRIRMLQQHEEGMRCGLDRMVPLALIVNELLTNAFKYAFPEDGRGTIQVRTRSTADGGMVMEIRDDGIGMDAVAKRPGGIGTMLIEALVSQIGATMERTEARGAGTGWRLAVPPEAGAI